MSGPAKDGGPAFPLFWGHYETSGEGPWGMFKVEAPGLTRLDFFAGCALIGSISNNIHGATEQHLIEEAWRMGRRMLETDPQEAGNG